MASLPNSVATFLNRAAISPRASSQEIRRKSLASLLPPSLGRGPSHGIQHAIRRVHPVQILRHLGAQKSARHRMRRITLNPRGAPVLDRNQHTTRIRTIMRAGGMNDFLHEALIIR